MILELAMLCAFDWQVPYPPCTATRKDVCTEPPRPKWPTLYIPCPPGEYCPPHDIPHTGKAQRRMMRELERERMLGEPEE